MKTLSSYLLLVAFFIGMPVPIKAYPEDYSPFPHSKPNPFPLAKLELLERNNDFELRGLTLDGVPTPLLRLSHSQEDDFVALVSVLDNSGDVLLAPTAVSEYGFWNDAFTADLNGDSKPDYIVIVGLGGVGLGTYKDDVVFVLSTDSGYRTTTVHSWYSGEEDFVDLRRNGRCQYIHTAFTYREDPRGRTRSYWVYNILEISGPELRPANHRHPIFPKWIWYTYRPNHKGSLLVSRREALNWFDSAFESIFWMRGREFGETSGRT